MVQPGPLARREQACAPWARSPEVVTLAPAAPLNDSTVSGCAGATSTSAINPTPLLPLVETVEAPLIVTLEPVSASAPWASAPDVVTFTAVAVTAESANCANRPCALAPVVATRLPSSTMVPADCA